MGPTWKGLYGSTETLSDGSTVTVDDAYLLESITSPGAKVVEGFTNIMPTVNLSQDEVDVIIEYIKTLQ